MEGERDRDTERPRETERDLERQRETEREGKRVHMTLEGESGGSKKGIEQEMREWIRSKLSYIFV